MDRAPRQDLVKTGRAAKKKAGVRPACFDRIVLANARGSVERVVDGFAGVGDVAADALDRFAGREKETDREKGRKEAHWRKPLRPS